MSNCKCNDLIKKKMSYKKALVLCADMLENGIPPSVYRSILSNYVAGLYSRGLIGPKVCMRLWRDILRDNMIPLGVTYKITIDPPL